LSALEIACCPKHGHTPLFLFFDLNRQLFPPECRSSLRLKACYVAEVFFWSFVFFFCTVHAQTSFHTSALTVSTETFPFFSAVNNMVTFPLSPLARAHLSAQIKSKFRYQSCFPQTPAVIPYRSTRPHPVFSPLPDTIVGLSPPPTDTLSGSYPYRWAVSHFRLCFSISPSTGVLGGCNKVAPPHCRRRCPQRVTY